MSTKQKNPKVVILCECAIMAALATVLSMIKFLDLPYGGSVTAFSIVPLVVISYRHGIKWGLVTGFAFSLIQLLLDSSTLSYATSIAAAIAIIMLDYILAYTFVGVSGIFRNLIKNPIAAAVTGTIMVCVIRYIFHVISGCTVWAGVSIPSSDGLLYSISYNATYMLPETIINTAVVFWLFSCLNFGSMQIERAKKQKNTVANTLCTSAAVLSIMIAVIIDAIAVFGKLQNAESGELDITLISNVDFGFVGIVTAIGIALCIVFAVISKLINNKNK